MNADTPALALTVTELCRAARISRSMYYTLPLDRRPHAVMIGTKIVIPVESAREWLASMPAAKWDQKRGVHTRGAQ